MSRHVIYGDHNVNTPRWFYAVLAGCAVVLTLAASLALLGSAEKGRYQSGAVNGNAILDTRTGGICFPGIPRTEFSSGDRQKIDGDDPLVGYSPDWRSKPTPTEKDLVDIQARRAEWACFDYRGPTR